MKESFTRTRLAIPGSQVSVNNSILNVAVTKPVLNEAKIGTHIQKVCCNAVLKAMKMLLGLR